LVLIGKTVAAAADDDLQKTGRPDPAQHRPGDNIRTLLKPYSVTTDRHGDGPGSGQLTGSPDRCGNHCPGKVRHYML